MTFLHELPIQQLQYYLTAPYACSYLPEREARSQVATPSHLIDTSLFSELARMGFRRSGLYVYRPRCAACNACTPARVPVESFRIRRSQRRCLARNADVACVARPLRYDEAHYRLYRRYQSMRHPGGGMDRDDPEQYRAFLLSSRIDSQLLEFRLDERVIMVSLVDRLLDGLSAVYTFYDPDLAPRSLGVFNILTQIELAQRMGLDYLYLGYWIEGSPKMAYKAEYRPLEVLRAGTWQRLEGSMP
jgi:arginine-tRNA-protein transferase